MRQSKDKSVIALDGSSLTLGPVTLPADFLKSAPVQDYTRSACVLAQDTIKVSVRIGDQMVPCKATLMITREPVGNEELAKVSDVAEARDKAAKDREKEEQDHREHEIQSAVNLTKTTMIETAEMLGRQNKAPDIAAQIKSAIDTMSVLRTLTGTSA